MNENKSNGARGLILIGHALVWAAAMLGASYAFKDQPWAKNLFMWMIVGFTLANGLLMNVLGGKSRPRC